MLHTIVRTRSPQRDKIWLLHLAWTRTPQGHREIPARYLLPRICYRTVIHCAFALDKAWALVLGEDKTPKLKRRETPTPQRRTTGTADTPEIEEHVLTIFGHLALDHGIVAGAHDDEGYEDLSHGNGCVAHQRKVISEANGSKQFGSANLIVSRSFEGRSIGIRLDWAVFTTPHRLSGS